jgi:hypothetical protein
MFPSEPEYLLAQTNFARDLDDSTSVVMDQCSKLATGHSHFLTLALSTHLHNNTGEVGIYLASDGDSMLVLTHIDFAFISLDRLQRIGQIPTINVYRHGIFLPFNRYLKG